MINLFCLVSVLLSYSYFVACVQLCYENCWTHGKSVMLHLYRFLLTMPLSSAPKVAVVETFCRMYIDALWNIQIQTMLSILNNHSLKSRLVGDGFYFCKILSLTLFLSTWRIFVDIFWEFILVCFLHLDIDFDILWKTSLQNEFECSSWKKL